MKQTLPTLAAVSMFVLAGCSPAPGDAPSADPSAEPTEAALSELAGTSWVLVEIMGEPPLEGTEITLEFGEHDLSGRACNRYSGAYTTSLERVADSDGTLTISEVVSTDMACMEPAGVMEQEQSYFNILARVSTFEIDGEGRLIIGHPTADPCCLSFEPASGARAPAPLDGTAWRLVSINGAERIPESDVTLAFSAGQVYGSAGCNDYSADYRGGEIQIIRMGAVVAAEMACQDEGLMAQEAAFLAALPAIRRYTLDGETLTLTSADGGGASQIVLVFQVDTQAAASVTTLAGTIWILASLNGESPLDGTELRLKFGDGSVGGFAGCNTFGGNTSIGQNGRIRMYYLGGTHERCTEPAGVMEQEAVYMELLTRITRFQITGVALELTSEDGARLIFTAAPG